MDSVNSIDARDLLALYNLEDEDIERITLKNVNHIFLSDIWLKPTYPPCPVCGSVHPSIKDYRTKLIKTSVVTDREAQINYHCRRYKCPDCGRSYQEDNPFVFKHMRISSQSVVTILKQLKSFNATFSSVAKANHVSPTTVAYIFDHHVSIPRRTLPKYLSFDECYAYHHDKDKYVCVLLDYETNKPVDILNSRRLEVLERYFSEIPQEERDKVLYVTHDMYDTYNTIRKKYLRNAKSIIDRFHLIQEENNKIDSIRRRLMKGQSKDSEAYKLLKHFNWAIREKPDTLDKYGNLKYDPGANKKYNQSFKCYMNYYDIRERIFSLFPELLRAWNLRNQLDDFFNCSSIDEGTEQLNKIIAGFKDSDSPELKDFGKTMAKWRVQIVNSLTVIDYYYEISSEDGHMVPHSIHLSSAKIENRNDIIKCIKKNANGYINWARFRNRLMYVLDPDASFFIVPIENPAAQQEAKLRGNERIRIREIRKQNMNKV